MRSRSFFVPIFVCAALAPAVAPVLGQGRRDPGNGVIDDRPRTTPAAEEAPTRGSSGRLEIPRNQGWVTDLAGMLDPAQRRELEALMESYKQGTTHEIALLTVESLRGEPIEKFALEVGRAWGLGDKEKNNGALLVVSKADRKVRIEVGRGLEGNLTDSICGRIIRDVIVPAFKQRRYGEGLKDGVVAIHEAIGGRYARIPSRAVAIGAGLLAAGLVPIVIFLIVVFVILARLRRRGTRRRGGFFFGPWLGGGGFGGGGGGGGFGGGFSGFGGGGGFSGGGASGGW